MDAILGVRKTAPSKRHAIDNVARQRNAFERRQGERENAGREQGERDPAVRTRRHRSFVTGLQRCGRGHRRCLASGPERGDQRGADAEQEENEVLARADVQRRCDAAKVAGPEVGAEGSESRTRHERTEDDTQRGAERTHDHSRQQRRGKLFAHRHAHGVQQRDFAATARHGERLRGVNQERAGEERDQRERRQVRPVRAGQAHGVVRRFARRDDLRTGRQQGHDGGANGLAVGLRRESKIDAIESAQPLQSPLRLADVQQSDGLGVCTGRQYASDAEAHAIERHLHVEVITDLEFQ